jgi:V/A-type H+-transporting ATPase subunit K
MKKPFSLAVLAGFASVGIASAQTAAVQTVAVSSPWRYISAAIAVGTACIAGGLAVAKIGAAAMGAMAENSELSGKALPYVGLAEGICLWGFLVALLILLL